MQALRTLALLAALMPAASLLRSTPSPRHFLAVSAKKKPAAAGGFGAAAPSTPKTKKKARRPRPAPSTRPRHSPVAGHAGQEEEGRRARPRSTVGHGRLRRERDSGAEARRQDRQTRRRRRSRPSAVRGHERWCEAELIYVVYLLSPRARRACGKCVWRSRTKAPPRRRVLSQRLQELCARVIPGAEQLPRRFAETTFATRSAERVARCVGND